MNYLGVDGRIIPKLTLYSERMAWTRIIWHIVWTSEISHEHDNDSVGPINMQGISCLIKLSLVFQEHFCSMELFELVNATADDQQVTFFQLIVLPALTLNS